VPWTAKQKAAYVAAFIDGEGWVRFGHDAGGPLVPTRFARQIGFTNTDRALFEMVLKFAADLGLKFSDSTIISANPKHSTRYNAILIGGAAAFRRFAKVIPLLHGPKRARLAQILASYRYNTDGSVALGAAASTPEMRKAMLARARAARGKFRIVKSA
jgi:LAGLIDADG DNA endonuclease family protein